MKKRQTFTLLAAGLALTFTLAGCTAPSSDTLNDEGTPTPTATLAATLGDAAVLLDPANEPVIVEGEWGNYRKLTVNPTSAAVTKTIPITSDDPGEWTTEDTLSAQQYVARYIVEQFYDSVALGTIKTLPEWKTTVAPNWVDTNFITLDKPGKNGYPTSLILTQNETNTFPIPIEDGKPRYSDVSLRFTKIEALTESEANYLTLQGTSTATLRSASDSIISTLKASGRTDEEIAKYDLVPGKESSLFISTTFRYSVAKTDNSWVIAGYDNTYDFQLK